MVAHQKCNRQLAIKTCRGTLTCRIVIEDATLSGQAYLHVCCVSNTWAAAKVHSNHENIIRWLGTALSWLHGLAARMSPIIGVNLACHKQ